MATEKQGPRRQLGRGRRILPGHPRPRLFAVSDLSGIDTRSRLLVAAIELFGSKGFDSTTMRDLGAHAGVGGPAAYNHFPSKDAILIEAVTWAMQRFAESVTLSDDPSAPPIDRLEQIVLKHVTWQIEHSRLAKANEQLISSDLLERLGQHAAHKNIQDMLRAHLDLVTDIVRTVLRDEPGSGRDPRLCALAIGSMCDDVIKWYRPQGKYSPAKIASSYWQLIRSMLGLRDR